MLAPRFLIHALYLSLGLALAAAGASARVDGWDAVVDLSRADSCRPIAAALQPLLEGKVASRYVKVTGSLDGAADALGLPVLYRNGGARPGAALESRIRACVPLIPTRRAGYFRGSPVADGSSLAGITARLHFENVELSVRCEGGQSRDFVALFLGGGWLSGYEAGTREYAGGKISGGVVLSGFLRIRFVGDCDSGRRAGSVAELRPASLLTERGTGRVALFANGLMRSDLTKLTLDVSGGSAADSDDLCIVHHHTWGLRVQGVRCGELGGGALLAYGSSDSSYRDVYFTGNTGPGLALGDPGHGAAISSFDAGGDACVGDDGDARDGAETCGAFIDASLESLRVEGVVEGNSFGNALVFGATDRVQLDVRGEAALSCSRPDCTGRRDRPMRGPNLGLYGGRCAGGQRDSLAGFVDSVFSGPPRDDCPGGRLELPKTRSRRGSLQVVGEVGGDRGFDGANPGEPDWNGIDVGAGFLGGSVQLAASVYGSDVGCPDACDDRGLDPRRLALFGADGDARGVVDLTGYRRGHTLATVGPYPFVRHDGERWIPLEIGAEAAQPLPEGDWIAHVARSAGSPTELGCRLDLLSSPAQRGEPTLIASDLAASPNAGSQGIVGRLIERTVGMRFLRLRARATGGVACPSSREALWLQLLPGS